MAYKPYGLGRVQQHDPRSRNFPALTTPEAPTKLFHKHYGRVLDQGSLGSCTGNAMAHSLEIAPLHVARRYFNEKAAVALYSRATVLDGFDGTYPPDDVGSSGLGVAKAAQESGYITDYHWAFGVQHLQESLAIGPALMGTVWYESMFEPEQTGIVTINGEVAGGHEYVCLGYIIEGDETWFHFLNSWSKNWGVASPSKYSDVSGGTFWMNRSTVDRLLSEGGDVMFPIFRG